MEKTRGSCHSEHEDEGDVDDQALKPCGSGLPPCESAVRPGQTRSSGVVSNRWSEKSAIQVKGMRCVCRTEAALAQLTQHQSEASAVCRGVC